ncbi:MAG: hypothetical protein RIT35_889 [Pseudomonadota bacterium]|jgi:uncharacterized membrane protein YfcA
MSMLLSETVLFLMFLGVFAGTLAGLLGIGGGIIIVPALLWFYESGNVIPKDQTMQFALATSLATICFTSITSVHAHNKRGAVLWTTVLKLSPGIIIGALLGTYLARLLSSEFLVIFFGVFLLIVSLQMGLGAQPASSRNLPGWFGTSFIGLFIGVISALVGVGGGTLTVPFLTWCNAPVRSAIASSSAVGFFIAVAGAVGYAVDEHSTNVSFSSGYVYWPAVAGIVPTSLIFAPLGARLAHTIPVKLLKSLFSIFSAIIGIKLIMQSYPSVNTEVLIIHLHQVYNALHSYLFDLILSLGITK